VRRNDPEDEDEGFENPFKELFFAVIYPNRFL